MDIASAEKKKKKKIGILINGWLFIPADRVSIFSFPFLLQE
jgi:hypothetical protein